MPVIKSPRRQDVQLLLCSRTVTALVEELGPPAEGHPAVPAAGRSLSQNKLTRILKCGRVRDTSILPLQPQEATLGLPDSHLLRISYCPERTETWPEEEQEGTGKVRQHSLSH